MSKQAVSFEVRAPSVDVMQHRQTVASRVAAYFEDHFSLPDRYRVVCLLDDQDFFELKLRAGQANRGIHLRLEGAALAGVVPQHFWNVLRPINATTGKCPSLFDSVVYLHGSTCETDIGLTLALAHELRHVVQYATQPKVCAANALLQRLPEPFNRDFTVWWDFPIEIDARIVAKGVAETSFGAEAVREYILARIESPVTEGDAKDWEFVLNINTAEPYDYIADTNRLVEKYRQPLIQAEQLHRSGVNY
jgi:hypothetical protein